MQLEKIREDGFLWKDKNAVHENLSSAFHLEIIKNISDILTAMKCN